jgi:hypothetical protein
MGSVVVVAVQPVGRHVTHFLQAVEHVAVEHLGAVGLVESFDIGVLRGLAGLDVLQGDSLALSPLGQGVGDELRAVVQANRQRRAAHLHQLVERPNDARSRQAGVDLNAQALAVEFVDDNASAMKSQLQPWLGWPAACRGCLMRAGSRFLPRRGRFSRSSQYTRQSTVLPQGLPWWRALSYSSPKPWRGFSAM